MKIILDLLLGFALATTFLAVRLANDAHSKADRIGAALVLIFPCLLIAIMLGIASSKGMLTFVPGPLALQFAVALGIVVALGGALLLLVDNNGSGIPAISAVASSLIIVSCLGVVHAGDFPKYLSTATAILMGLSAVAGWGVIGTAGAFYLKDKIQTSTAETQREQTREKEYEQEEVSRYRGLGADATLADLLPSTWSRNAEVKQESRQRVEKWPELDDALSALLDSGNEAAIDYIAFGYEKPSAKLAPAWGRMLERQLKTWDVLQYDEYAGKWEPNLSPYFEGAQKIQKAGGDVRPQLKAWHAHLLKSKGLGNLAAFVKTLF